MSFWINVFSAGVANGTALLFATIGELLAERSGVLNLGVEGMMLLGAVTGYSVALGSGSVWLGLLAAMITAGVLALLHALAAITLRADQVVSGLALTFLGTGLALVLGEGLARTTGGPVVPVFSLPGLEAIPFIGPVFFREKSLLVYAGYLLVPLCWFILYRPRPGLHLRAIGEQPSAADALGLPVARLRYFYTVVGGMLAGLAGASLSLSISPGWFSEFTTSGQGWIAIALVIFAQWNPLRAALGAYLFGSLRRLVLDLQGPEKLLFFRNPFFQDRNLQFFLEMLPYAVTVIVLVIGSREAVRRRLGAPAALGRPYVRGERGL